MYALVDCNNFYASCERVFQPLLKNQPVIVLSNNDGCVIARSNEAKQCGIEMGAPYFKVRQMVEQLCINVRSSNYELYGDMSRRVMLTLEQLTSDIEIYSIDEAFCDLSGFQDRDLITYGREMRETVHQWTGIPVSVGIGPTKTLAKAANSRAKKTDGVFFVEGDEVRRNLLASMNVRDVWGIGRQHEKFLTSYGIHTALDLANAPDQWIRHHLQVTGLRTVHELRGIACIGLDDQVPAKKSITTSRMFGRAITEVDELIEAMTTYTTRAAEKLRGQHRQARHMDIFFSSSRHKKPFYRGHVAFDFPVATDYTPDLIRYAAQGVRRAFRTGFRYNKAGLMLSNLTSLEEQQLSFLHTQDEDQQTALMQTLDTVNRRWGTNTLFYAGAGIERPWRMKREMRSAAYTTNLREILVLDAQQR